MAKQKLVGENYSTPDLLAKVTGKSKYSEDFRAEGMLFCKLLLSPHPHARVTRLDTRAALAMPGVKAILTADDVPPPADFVTDSGAMVRANPKSERVLTNEPLYQGEPILAVAAVDELTAANAIDAIEIEFEPLPFCVDPLVSLRPGGPNARTEGNHWVRPTPPKVKEGEKPAPPPLPEIRELKWTEAQFADYALGKMPMGEVPAADQWTLGDIEEGFKSAALVLDETFVTSNTSNQPLESRSVMAYWENGKVHLFCSTQSTAQSVPGAARWLGMKPEDVRLVSEYCGGGFGAKSTGTMPLIIPALLAKKTSTPVMMRITREEEHAIGRARPAIHARVKAGFSKEGRITALDLFVVGDNGPYEVQSDFATTGRISSLLYQPQTMRWRGIGVLTNTPPRGPQRGPGGVQVCAVIEPVLAKAARMLNIDQVAIRRINAPSGQASFGPPGRPDFIRGKVTSAFVKEALDKGALLFKWEERMARSGKRSGSKVRGTGVAMSAYSGGSFGFDGLFILKPDGRMYIQSGVGNLGTESVFDVHRVAAEMMDMPWERCEVTWGDSAKHLPWTCVSGGSATTHAMTRAAHAAATDGLRKLREIAAKDFGGKPEDYEVAGERVFRKGGGRGMTFAQAAQRAIQLGGVYDGHELPKDINAYTKRSATALAGQGLMAVARDSSPVNGRPHSFTVGFAEVEIDLETGQYHVVDYLGVGDVGTVINPRNVGAQILGGSLQGIGHAMSQKWVFDQHYGVSLARRFYQNRPPTILDAPLHADWAVVGIPDPTTPVGARGVGEPPVGAGMCSVLNAISAALGDDIFRRAPVTADMILTSLEAGKPTFEPLTAQI